MKCSPRAHSPRAQSTRGRELHRWLPIFDNNSILFYYKLVSTGGGGGGGGGVGVRRQISIDLHRAL